MTNVNRLLIVEDDETIADMVALVATRLGYDVARAEPISRLAEICANVTPTVIVLDLMMPHMDGVQVLRALARQRSPADIIILSAADPRVLDATARVAQSHGLLVRETLHKPIGPAELASVLKSHLVWVPAVTSEDLALAIEREEIECAYQPKVLLTPREGWTVTGAEALARWRHPRLGLIGPEHFMDRAEKEGLAGALTRLVIAKALQQTRRLHDLGYAIGMAINVSPVLLADETLPEFIAQHLHTNRLDGGALTIEVTETSSIDNAPLTAAGLTRFRLVGARIAMDDYGDGCASLAQLYRLPFSELKIDRSIIAEAQWSREARVFVRALIELAHGLDVEVCAEGVETPDMLDFLRSVGCNLAQGYLISKPVTDRELVAFLADNLYTQSRQIAQAARVEG